MNITSDLFNFMFKLVSRFKKKRGGSVEYSILTTLQSLNKMIYYNQLKECHSWTRGLSLQ
jgi:hypothetical protein